MPIGVVHGQPLWLQEGGARTRSLEPAGCAGRLVSGRSPPGRRQPRAHARRGPPPKQHT